MTEIKITIDENCKFCKKTLIYFKKLHKRNIKAYGSFILHPLSRFVKENRDLNDSDRIKGIKLTPDYNSDGYLTHFHMLKEK